MKAIAEVDEIDPKALWPKSLVEFTEVIASAFKDAGKSVAMANQDALIAVRAMARYHGGRIFYLPQGKKLETALRHLRIWQEFNGHNVTELAQRHELSIQAVYRIVARQRRLSRRAGKADQPEATT